MSVSLIKGKGRSKFRQDIVQSTGVRRMTRLLTLAVIGVVLVYTNQVCAQGRGAYADVVFINGKIWTVNKSQPEAEALAAWHGRILAVGDNADMRQLANDKTHVIDLKGRRVVPG